MTPAERFTEGVTVVLHPSTRRIGAMVRDKQRGVGQMLLWTVGEERNPSAYPATTCPNG